MANEAPTQERMEEVLRAFLTGALATLVILATTLVFEIVHERTDWPLGQSGWEIANIVVILVLMLAFGTFALARWRELVRQITERKRAEEAIRESEDQFRTSLETLLDGFAIFSAIRDDAGRIVDFRYEYINEAGCRLNQRTREEQVGYRLLELLPEHKETGLFDEYMQVVDTSHYGQGRRTYSHGEGTAEKRRTTPPSHRRLRRMHLHCRLETALSLQ